MIKIELVTKLWTIISGWREYLLQQNLRVDSLLLAGQYLTWGCKKCDTPPGTPILLIIVILVQQSAVCKRYALTHEQRLPGFGVSRETESWSVPKI